MIEDAALITPCVLLIVLLFFFCSRSISSLTCCLCLEYCWACAELICASALPREAFRDAESDPAPNDAMVGLGAVTQPLRASSATELTAILCIIFLFFSVLLFFLIALQLGKLVVIYYSCSRRIVIWEIISRS